MSFEFLLFSTDADTIRSAVTHGVNGVIVDWEHIGKELRQSGADTEINHDTADDLRAVRAATTTTVICRINPHGPQTPEEIETAITEGADEILVPMVRRPEVVADILARVEGRCGVGILVETIEAVAIADVLAKLPISRVYMGLNDLAIARRERNIFTPLIDGTVDRVRECFEQPFGFGGLTDPDRGAPIPCRLLISEMARLRCAFSFLRRSYYRDVAFSSPAILLASLRSAVEGAGLRNDAERLRDREDLIRAIGAWN